MAKRVLLTGAGGFVGSHVLRHLLINTDWDIICPVTFKHFGRSKRIESSMRSDGENFDHRVHTIPHDLTTPFYGVDIARLGKIDYIFNVASESHVDRSIQHPAEFIGNNVNLITNLLDLAVKIKPQLFLQMSTDEVYGPADVGYAHVEWDTIKPSNPYSASKAAQEAIAFAYWRTYGVPLIVTNTMNIVGEMQDPEKFMPMVIKKIRSREKVTIHAGLDNPGEPVVGSRCWLHARNLADAWLFLAKNVEPRLYPDHSEPHRFHIVGDERTNLEIAELIAHLMGKELKFELADFHASRPGHDLRYALNGERIRKYGWQAPIGLEQGLKKTVDWTLAHPEWLA